MKGADRLQIAWPRQALILLESPTIMPSGHDTSSFGDFPDLLRNLVREPSVVGTEDSFFRVLLRELQELDLELTYYQPRGEVESRE